MQPFQVRSQIFTFLYKNVDVKEIEQGRSVSIVYESKYKITKFCYESVTSSQPNKNQFTST